MSRFIANALGAIDKACFYVGGWEIDVERPIDGLPISFAVRGLLSTGIEGLLCSQTPERVPLLHLVMTLWKPWNLLNRLLLEVMERKADSVDHERAVVLLTLAKGVARELQLLIAEFGPAIGLMHDQQN